VYPVRIAGCSEAGARRQHWLRTLWETNVEAALRTVVGIGDEEAIDLDSEGIREGIIVNGLDAIVIGALCSFLESSLS
jgi:hypothetical protein